MVENTANKLVYLIGESRVFPFGIRFLDKDDIVVFLQGDDQSQYSVTLVNGIDYTIEQKEDYSDGANITLLIDPLPEGKTLCIMRKCDLRQELSLPEHGKLPSKMIERNFDKTFMVMQQFDEELNRCIKIDVLGDSDPAEYFNNIKKVTVNAKDVALNAADAAAHSALVASVSERNISLIWAELTGDQTLADNALITVKEAAEATGAIKVAKEIAIGEIQNIGSTAIAATEHAAKEANDAAQAATNSAGAITGAVADQLAIQISQAVGADGALGAAIQGGIKDVEDARQEALDKANKTLSDINQNAAGFEQAKESALAQIQGKVDSVSLDVQTVLAKAQVIADGYLNDAKATVSGNIADLKSMKQQAINAGNHALVEIINKRIEELNKLSGYLDDADAAKDAAEQFKNAASGYANNALSSAQNAAGSLTQAQNSAANALKSAQDAALKASEAEASALAAGAAAGEAATSAAQLSITAHNANSQAHKAMFDSKLSLSGGTMTGNFTMSAYTYIKRDCDDKYTYIYGGSGSGKGAYLLLTGQDYVDNGGYFVVSAVGGGTSALLTGRQNGTLTWNGKNIVRSVNGNNADDSGAVTITGLINKPVAIPANVDLNDYTTNGFYNCLSNSIAATVTNSPIPIAFALEVFGDTPTGASIKYQRVTDYGHYRTWVRVRYNGTWGAWKQLVNAQGINNAQTAVHGGANYDSGASLVLWGKDHNNGSDAPGMFKIRANNGTTASELIATPAGGLSWNNKDITGGYPNYAAATQTSFSALSGGSYTPSADGFVTVVGTNTNNGTLKVSVNGTLVYHQNVNSDNISCCPLIPVKAGDTIKAEVTGGENTTGYFNFFSNR